MEQHNGWIKVQSEAGKGTKFRLALPLAPSGAKVNETAVLAKG
jgi:signal transduction histidine kinase